jgi:DNA-binding IclR family transcriptional regulator
VWNGQEAVVVEQVAIPHQVKHTAAIGTRYAKFESSSVRVFLAELAPARVAELIESGRIVRNPDDGLPQDYAVHLAELRGQEYAVNDGCTTDEEFVVSAPVRDYRGMAVGCITASAPRSRVQKLATADQLVAAVRKAAAEVSARLGQPQP